jgi:hypothetical protein
MRDLGSLWLTLSLCRDFSSCLEDWRLSCPDAYPLLKTFLFRPPGLVADYYPSPTIGLPLEIRSHPDGSHFAVHDSFSMGDASPLRLSPADVAAWRIDWPAFDRALCLALKARALHEDCGFGKPWARIIGRLPDGRRILLMVSSDPAERLEWARQIASLPKPLMIVTFLTDLAMEHLLTASGHSVVTLDSCATASKRGPHVRLDVRLNSSVAAGDHAATPKPAAQDPEWAARGPRYAISADYRSILDIAAEVLHPITNPNVSAAIEILVKHALGEASAKSAAILIPKIQALRAKKGLRKATTYDMAHFFSTKVGLRRATWPFHHEIVRNARRHGLFWLEL